MLRHFLNHTKYTATLGHLSLFVVVNRMGVSSFGSFGLEFGVLCPGISPSKCSENSERQREQKSESSDLERQREQKSGWRSRTSARTKVWHIFHTCAFEKGPKTRPSPHGSKLVRVVQTEILVQTRSDSFRPSEHTLDRMGVGSFGSFGFVTPRDGHIGRRQTRVFQFSRQAGLHMRARARKSRTSRTGLRTSH